LQLARIGYLNISTAEQLVFKCLLLKELPEKRETQKSNYLENEKIDLNPFTGERQNTTGISSGIYRGFRAYKNKDVLHMY
jgi:hypothetical protein